MIRQATQDDSATILSLMHDHFFKESNFKDRTIDFVQSYKQVCSWVRDFCLVAEDAGRIIGFTAGSAFRTFYKDVEFNVEIFFVLSEYRGRGYSRSLVDALVKHCDMNGVKIIHTSCLSGLGHKNDQLFVNLWSKFGFSPLGSVMMRSL